MRIKIDESNDWSLKLFAEMFNPPNNEETIQHKEQVKLFRKNKGGRKNK